MQNPDPNLPCCVVVVVSFGKQLSAGLNYSPQDVVGHDMEESLLRRWGQLDAKSKEFYGPDYPQARTRRPTPTHQARPYQGCERLGVTGFSSAAAVVVVVCRPRWVRSAC